MSRWGRLAALTVFLAGFLTMHGFLAVSASAAPAHPVAHAGDLAVHVAGNPAGTAAGTAPAEGHAAPPGPADGHGPLDHHDVVGGCIVALVGIAVVTLAVLSALRRRTDPGGSARAGFPCLPSALPSRHPTWLSTPRFGLCVIRV